MATIAEIIAARQAAKNGTSNEGKKETLAETAALNEAIDRIDPPGKSARAETARKLTGLILSKDMPCAPEARGQATPIAGPEPRMLGARVGEAITIESDAATAQSRAWDAVRNQWETDLCIMADPEPGSESAWIALRSADGAGLPILLHKLPFWPHPARVHPPNEPF